MNNRNKKSSNKKLLTLILGLIIALFITSQSISIITYSKIAKIDDKETESKTDKEDNSSEQSLTEVVSSHSQVSYDFSLSEGSGNESDDNAKNTTNSLISSFTELIQTSIQVIINTIISPNAP